MMKQEINKVIEECKEINKEFNYFNYIIENPKKEGKGKLDGVYVSVKDNICVKGVPSSAGSEIIKDYKPVFDAYVIEKIKQEGGIIIGKTAQDEFGFGGFNVNVAKCFKIPLNPFDKTRVCGGSSGGAGGITQKASFRHIAIAESTGGSIANPACFCGVYGLTPSYGLVSRYGLIDYANSLDKIGIMAKEIEEVALMLKVIAGYDKRDSTSVKVRIPDYEKILKEKPKVKIGIIKEGFGKGVDKKIVEVIRKRMDELKEKGFMVKEISLPLTFKYGIASYYILALSEASTNLAKYCGLRYGMESSVEGKNFNDYFKEIRSKYFGKEAKRRIILGTFTRMAGYRDAFYIKAAKTRTLIIEEYKKVFDDVDVIVSPTMPILAPKIEEVKKLTPLQNYMMDQLTVGPNLAGLPHLNIPVGFINSLPVGLLAITNHFEEGKLLQFAKIMENETEEKDN